MNVEKQGERLSVAIYKIHFVFLHNFIRKHPIVLLNSECRTTQKDMARSAQDL
jgi:hypothetical protein